MSTIYGLFSRLTYFFADLKQENTNRIQAAITELNKHSINKPAFLVQSGTLSRARGERYSVGIDLPYDEMEKRGFTVQCTDFGARPEMIRFFQYLEDDLEITSFMPRETLGGYLKGVDDAIAECLRKNKTLEALDVHYCHIGEEGVLNIVKALKENKALKYLNIRSNGINNDILKELLRILKNHNQTLVRFSFTQNNFPDERNLDGGLIKEIDLQLKENAKLLQAGIIVPESKESAK